MRTPSELLASALAVIDRGFSTGVTHYRYAGRGKPRKEILLYPTTMAALFSGGHDSTAAVHVASQHPRFDGLVYHINTGIGSKMTRKHVEDTAAELGWTLKVYQSKYTYERFIRERGFPGPGMHQWAYQRLKDRCVRQIVNRQRIVLITGCRSQESVRRMGHVEPVKIGEPFLDKKTGETKVDRKNRYWVAPCHDWSSEEQAAYMEEHDLPKNPVKISLGMSGECFCGAFASPGELERVRHHCPDVGEEIDRLAEIARACGKHDKWGQRPPQSRKGVQVAQSGPLCSTCDLRAAAAGVVFSECKTESLK